MTNTHNDYRLLINEKLTSLNAEGSILILVLRSCKSLENISDYRRYLRFGRIILLGSFFPELVISCVSKVSLRLTETSAKVDRFWTFLL